MLEAESEEMNISLSSDSEEKSTVKEEPLCPNVPRPKRKDLFSPNVCKVAKKYQISDRALTEIVVDDNVANENSNEVIASVMTCKHTEIVQGLLLVLIFNRASKNKSKLLVLCFCCSGMAKCWKDIIVLIKV